MVVLKQLRNFLCLLGENVHVVLNSDSHWTYLEQVSLLSRDVTSGHVTSLPVTWVITLSRDVLIMLLRVVLNSNSHWFHLEQVR